LNFYEKRIPLSWLYYEMLGSTKWQPTNTAIVGGAAES